MQFLRILVLVMTLAAANSVLAADEDGGLWATASFAKGINEKFSAATALQLRFDDDIDTLERVLLRPSVSYRLDPRQVLTLGYDAHFVESPRDRVEQRLWQQYQVSEPFSAFTGTLRIRLEERFIDHVDGVPVRVRLKASAKFPLSQSPWFFTAANETFIGFNDITGGQDDGFHENRAFLGFGRPIADGVVGQIGYQNQFLDGSGQDRMIHQMFVSIGFNFP